jgi:predicted SAM-dependent methyltransferase
MKIYVGCALPPFHQQHYDMFPDLDKFVWVDKYMDHPRIIKWDAEHLEVADNSVEVIYASHLLEHIEHDRILALLDHWKQKLQAGGEIVVNVPDLCWAAKQIIKYENGYLLDGYYNTFSGEHGVLSILYGSQTHEGEYHKGGFTKRYLEDLGFKVEEDFDAHDMMVLIGRFTK